MRITKYSLIVIFLFSLSCMNKKQQKQKKEEINQKTVSEKSFQETKNGMVHYELNHTMEWASRIDKLNIKGDSIYGETKQKVEGSDNDFKVTDLKSVAYVDQSIEQLVRKNHYRVEKKNDANILLKIIKDKDTTILYSYNLADKSKFIRSYFKVMKSLYPESENFIYPDE